MLRKVYTKEEVQIVSKSLVGKTFGELNNYQSKIDNFNKGAQGQFVEEKGFFYRANNKSQPDFKEAGIELKVTPYKINSNGSLSAKERLVLNIINYMTEYKNTFYTSQFWRKNNLIQIIWYLHESNKRKEDMQITHELLFSFSENDLVIIENDWNIIINKIKSGKAHEISEADTMYLGACTKGKNSKSIRKQPFSSIFAKQRAFSLKTTYMTQLVRSIIGGEKFESIAGTKKILSTFEDSIQAEIKRYIGKSVNDLASEFDVMSNSKNINEILVAKMLGIKGKVSKTDEFIKANIQPKTIRINESGRIIESMSFPAFHFCQLIKEKWESSMLYNYFFSTKFMFVVFTEKKGIYYFDKIQFWNMPLDVLNSQIQSVWKETVDVIKNGNIVKEVKNGSRLTNFPGMANNQYCHVRPHAKDSSDTFPLPTPDKLTGAKEYTKHCFWLSNKYIMEIINHL